jgi:hypothetical protein
LLLFALEGDDTGQEAAALHRGSMIYDMHATKEQRDERLLPAHSHNSTLFKRHYCDAARGGSSAQGQHDNLCMYS